MAVVRSSDYDIDLYTGKASGGVLTIIPADNVREALTLRFCGRQCKPFDAMEDMVYSRAGLN